MLVYKIIAMITEIYTDLILIKVSLAVSTVVVCCFSTDKADIFCKKNDNGARISKLHIQTHFGHPLEGRGPT